MWRRRDNKPLTADDEPGKQTILDPFWEFVLPDDSDDELWDSESDTEIQSIEKKAKESENAHFSLVSLSMGSSKTKEGSIGSTLGSRSYGTRGQSTVGSKSYESASTFSKVASLGAFSGGSAPSDNPRGSRSIGSFYSGSIDSKLSNIRQKKVEDRAPLDSFWEFVLGEQDDADETVWDSVDMVSAASSNALDDVSQVMSEAISGDDGSCSASRTRKKCDRSIRRTNSDSEVDRKSCRFWNFRRSGRRRKTSVIRNGLFAASAASAAAILRPTNSGGRLKGPSADKGKRNSAKGSSVPKRNVSDKRFTGTNAERKRLLRKSAASKKSITAKKPLKVGRRKGVAIAASPQATKKQVSSRSNRQSSFFSSSRQKEKNIPVQRTVRKSEPTSRSEKKTFFSSNGKTKAAAEVPKRACANSSPTGVAKSQAASGVNVPSSSRSTRKSSFFSSGRQKDDVAKPKLVQENSPVQRTVRKSEPTSPSAKKTMFSSNAKTKAVTEVPKPTGVKSTSPDVVKSQAATDLSALVSSDAGNLAKNLGASAAVTAALLSFTSTKQEVAEKNRTATKYTERKERQVDVRTNTNQKPTTKSSALEPAKDAASWRTKRAVPVTYADPDTERGSSSRFGNNANAGRVHIKHAKRYENAPEAKSLASQMTKLSKAAPDSKREIAIRNAANKKGHWEWEIDSTAVPAIKSLRGTSSGRAEAKKSVGFLENIGSSGTSLRRGATSNKATFLPVAASSFVLASAAMRPDKSSQERATHGVRRSSFHGTQPDKLFDLRPEIDPDAFQPFQPREPTYGEKASFPSKSRTKSRAVEVSEKTEAQTSLWPTTKEEFELQLKAAALLVPIGNEAIGSDWNVNAQTRSIDNEQLSPQRGIAMEATDEPTDEEMSLEEMSHQSVASNNHQILLQSLRNAKSTPQNNTGLLDATGGPHTGVYRPRSVSPQMSSGQPPSYPESTFMPVATSPGAAILGTTLDYESDLDSEEDMGEIRRKLWGGEKYSNPPGPSYTAATTRPMREARVDSPSSTRQDFGLVRTGSTSSDQRSVTL